MYIEETVSGAQETCYAMLEITLIVDSAVSLHLCKSEEMLCSSESVPIAEQLGFSYIRSLKYSDYKASMKQTLRLTWHLEGVTTLNECVKIPSLWSSSLALAAAPV